jgi:hypothetical protein
MPAARSRTAGVLATAALVVALAAAGRASPAHAAPAAASGAKPACGICLGRCGGPDIRRIASAASGSSAGCRSRASGAA